jgi:putative transposase
MCEVLNVSRAGYYKYKKLKTCPRKIEDEQLKTKIAEIYDRSRKTYGVPRILAMLKRENISISKRRCGRLMRELGIEGVSKKIKKPRQKVKPEIGSAPDLIKRNFVADKPNKTWFADITYIKTYAGWLYLAVVFDIFSRKIVGWSMSNNMKAELVNDALKAAICRRNPAPGLIHHSDHGSQYRSILFGKTLKRSGIRPSMGAISSPWDNAVTESLMSTIKAECVHRQTFENREIAKLEIFDYIERFYNPLRIHSALGNLTPDEFEAEYYEKMVV